ncbi:MAG TPA: NAD(P)-dependent oxidoreductase [Hyphomicrobiaceae bacterium]|nr:NAD(P)-dependent oxidoreductase [Hyphomicrobiaceae bacterium]
MTDSRHIGFVGLGAMGHAMATTLLRHQYRVTGYDIREEARKKFETAGGNSASDAKGAARDVAALVLMTVNIDQAEAVLFENGALDSLPKGATVVLMATCAPSRVAALSRRVEATGRTFVDAPVSGGVVGAEAGTLTIMAAASQETFTRARPMLSAMGSGLVHIGTEPGQGAAMKIVNQLLCGVHIAVAAEGLAFAEKQGIDPKVALEILSGSAASSWMLKNRGPRMLQQDPAVSSAVDIFVKDLNLVLDAGRSAKMGLPLAALAHQYFLSASGMGLGAADDSQVIEAYRALAKLTK